MVAWVALAAVVLASGWVHAAHGLSVEVGPPQSARPGELVTHVFTIRNTGTVDDQFLVNLMAPQGWTALPVEASVSLAPGEQTRLFITVMIPPRAEAGVYTVELTATSVGDPTVSEVAVGVVELLPTLDLLVESVRVDRAQPGTEARHLFRVHNKGNVVDTYGVEVRSSPDWPSQVSPATLTLLPGMKREVEVAVFIPRTEAPGTRYRVRIEVASQTDPTMVRTMWATAMVAPPPPEEVRVDLYPELPLTLRFGLTDAGEPVFSMSLTGTVPSFGRVSASRALSMLGITGQTAGFRAADWGLDWGTVAMGGTFISLSGEGFLVNWYGPERREAEAVFVAQGYGVAGSIRWLEGSLRALVVERHGTDARTLTEVQFVGGLGERLSLSGVLATGWLEDGRPHAYRVRPTMRVGGLSGFVELSEVHDGFPGQVPREHFGWGLTIGTALDPLQGAGSVMTTVALRDVGPPPVHATTQELSITLSRRPAPRTLNQFTLSSVSVRSDDDPATMDSGSLELSIRVTDVDPLVTWSVTGVHRTSWNRLTDASTTTTSARGSVRAVLGPISARATLALQQTDLSELRSSMSLTCSFPQVPLTPSLGLSVEGQGRSNISASVAWVDIAGWDLSAALTVPLSPEGGFSLSSAFGVPVRFPLFGPIYGAIRGRVFVDVSGTGRFDPEDEPVAGLLLVANGRQAITGSDGRFVFTPFLPGIYQVTIDDLPFGFYPLRELPLTVELSAGQALNVDIPLESRSLIRGRVFHDLDQDGRRDPGDPGVAGVQILIRNGIADRRVTTDTAGRFAEEVPSGTYRVELDEATLPVRYEPTTPTSIDVHVEERGFATAEFGVWQRPRLVVVEPTVPIARLNYAPAVPRVDQEVTFDASDSQAIGDQTIETYAWEFRLGRSVISAIGERVTVVFEQGGTWLVFLRVTDTAGQSAETQRTVTVR